MKDGLLFASGVISDEGARGIAVSEARKGDDVGISNIEGVIKLKTGKVTIGKVPNVQKGGSRNTDFARLKEEISEGALIGAIGVEALVALKQVGIKSGYLYGVKEAAIEATYCGLPFLVLCAEDGISPLVQRLEEENLDYEIVDLRKDVS
jgi:putative transcriptional regulator